MKHMTWTCHCCGEERPDEFISVYTTDVSKEHGLPAGSMTMNVRYCNDRSLCVDAAPGINLFKGKESSDGD